MRRLCSLLAVLSLASCTAAVDAPPLDDQADTGKDDSAVAVANIAPSLSALYTFLRDDKNLIAQLGPEGTDATNVRKRVKVVRYTEFGRATDVAARAIASKYQVAVGTGYRRATGLVDLISVGDMYVTVHAGYGDDAFVDKLIAAPKRTQARNLASALLPEAALLQLDHASTTSTGNYVLVLGDLSSGQAIVMTVEYEVT